MLIIKLKNMYGQGLPLPLSFEPIIITADDKL
jgi:hypothetical protein